MLAWPCYGSCLLKITPTPLNRLQELISYIPHQVGGAPEERDSNEAVSIDEMTCSKSGKPVHRPGYLAELDNRSPHSAVKFLLLSAVLPGTAACSIGAPNCDCWAT
jgi:hypothetical protein